ACSTSWCAGVRRSRCCRTWGFCSASPSCSAGSPSPSSAGTTRKRLARAGQEGRVGRVEPGGLDELVGDEPDQVELEQAVHGERRVVVHVDFVEPGQFGGEL